MNLITVILSGGVGIRLWPISRQAYPKLFMSFYTTNAHVLTKETHLTKNSYGRRDMALILNVANVIKSHFEGYAWIDRIISIEGFSR